MNRKSGNPHGNPGGNPHKKDYHKKKFFQGRIDENVAREFKEKCNERSLVMSDVLEMIIREALIRNAMQRIEKKIKQ